MDPLDKTDKKILKMLQGDGKLTSKELASHLNLSITPVYERVKRLELMGYIEKYVAVINKHKVGKGLIVFCNVSLKEHAKEALKRFEKDVSERREVLECYATGGMFDYLLKIVTTDMNSYHSFVMNDLSAIPNITNVQSSFVLGEVKNESAIEID